jgi:hypothetical protein
MRRCVFEPLRIGGLNATSIPLLSLFSSASLASFAVKSFF